MPRLLLAAFGRPVSLTCGLLAALLVWVGGKRLWRQVGARRRVGR